MIEAVANSPVRNIAVGTPRQREVLQLIAEENTTKEIAKVLGISPKTAETYRAPS
jgi:DNA-binding CsgD family transcriptional regulator